MAINLTDALNAATTKGKLADAKQIYLEGDTQTVQKEIEDINSRHNDLESKHKTVSDTVANLDSSITKLNTRDDQITKTLESITATGGASVATAVTYDNTISGLTSVNVNGAIDELTLAIKTGLAGKVDKASVVQESGDSEELVMSQKAISDRLNGLSSTISEVSDKANNAHTKAESASKMAEDNKSTLNTVTSDISKLKKKVDDIPATIPKFVSMTEAAYETLETKEADTYYMLTEE